MKYILLGLSIIGFFFAQATPSKLMKEGHYQEAYIAYTNLIFSNGANVSDGTRAQSVLDASRCLVKLNRANESMDFLKDVISKNREFPVVVACSQALGELPHTGTMVKGVYERTLRRAYNNSFSSCEHDRVLRLRWLESIMPNVLRQNKLRQRWFWNEVVAALEMNDRSYGASWKFLELTDISKLPDEAIRRVSFFGGDFESGPAPTDENGDPIFYSLPESWATAKCDGERWIFANDRRAAVDSRGRLNSAKSLGEFAAAQFGVDRLPCYNAEFDSILKTLGDDETLTHVASGVKRFTLPMEYNYLRMWRELKDYARIGVEYEQRHQLAKAIKAYEIAGEKDDVLRITKPSVSFVGARQVMTYAQVGKIDLVFKNTDELQFSIRQIDIDKYLDEVKKTGELFDIARLPRRDMEKYLSPEICSWSVGVEANDDFTEKKISITIPKKLPPSQYLLFAKPRLGGEIYTNLRVHSLAIVTEEFNLFSGGKIYVVDAQTGSPVSNATVQVFACGRSYGKKGVSIKERVVKTHSEGFAQVPEMSEDNGRYWSGFVYVTTVDGNYAIKVVGQGYWRNISPLPDNMRGVIITDRLAYRPGDTVKFKLWAYKCSPDGSTNVLEGAKFKFDIIAPISDDSIFSKHLTLDKFGGAEGEFKIEEDAKLGFYRLLLEGGTIHDGFLVEEYRKAEFEVDLLPSANQYILGDKVNVGLKAKYYWGEGVKNAKATIKVERKPRFATWHPCFDWAWLYGEGANWFFYDSDWYAGEGNLQIARCLDDESQEIAEGESFVHLNNVKLNEHGEAQIEWDTNDLRKLYGDKDQEFLISVSVTDDSMRTIDANHVLVVRAEPFRVYAWVQKPYYKLGDKVISYYHLDGIDQSSVKDVKYYLYKLNGEKLGEVTKEFLAKSVGQYRLSVEVTHVNGTKREGSRIFTVIGSADEGREFKYAPLELVPDKTLYAPGEKVKLKINADYENSTVFVKVRDEKTFVVQLTGKSADIEIPVSEIDKPNFFVEAWTVSNGRYIEEKREIMVPPSDKVGKAEIEIDEKFKPGDDVWATVRIYDENGRPSDVSAIMSVYDRALDAIAEHEDGWDLRKIFWRNRHGFVSSFLSCLDEDCFPAARAMCKLVACNAGDESMMCAPSQDCAMDMPSQLGIRKDFADTAYWNAKLESTGTSGVYKVHFKMPEDITSWNVKVWSISQSGRVAQASTEIITKKDLMLRMVTPRFFIERDEVLLSANVHNYSDKKIDACLSIDLGGVAYEGDTKPVRVCIKPNDEAKANWRIKFSTPGTLKLCMKVEGGGLADGVMKEIDVVSHSIEKTESFFKLVKNGELPRNGCYEGDVAMEIFKRCGFPMVNNRAQNLRVAVELADTLATQIDRSLDYLKYYEYECNEQTMNRFVPVAIARKLLEKRGLSSRLHDVDKLTKKSLQKLADRQNSDGGWGWFWGTREYSCQHMTATIVRGLAAAKKSGVNVPEHLIVRGCGWLDAQQKMSLEEIAKKKSEIRSIDVFTSYALVLAGKGKDVTVSRMLEIAYESRLKLPLYAQALLGLAFDLTGDAAKRDMIVSNIKEFIVRDNENLTAYLNLGNASYWWCWYGSDLEAHATVLKLFTKAKAEDEIVRGLALYLFNNRKSRTHWTNTRDTALVIEALTDYCQEYEQIDQVYVSAYLTYDTYKDPIDAAGLEVKVNRTISRVDFKEAFDSGRTLSGVPHKQKKIKEVKVPLKDLDGVKAGQMLEIRLDIDSKNDYEYILVEDFKAAGFEVIDTHSGWKHLGGAWGYVENREKKTSIFLRFLPRGALSLVYRVRVETPGFIHALPAKIEAMYAPKLKGNSAELRFNVGQ